VSHTAVLAAPPRLGPGWKQIMSLAEIAPLVLKLSIMTLVFTIGLGTEPRELTELLRRPAQLLRSLAAMSLVMPIVAVVLVKVFTLSPPVEVMLVCLSLSPIPPILPNKMVKAGGGHAYVMALLCTASLFAIVWAPIAGLLLDKIFAAEISIPAVPVAKLVFMTVLGPVIAGVIVRLVLPKLAERAAGPLGMVATVLLLLGLVLIVVKLGPAILSLIGHGTLFAIVAFLVAGLAVGHLLGGPEERDRTVLALATASRHPGVAMSLAGIVFPAEKAVPPAILLYLLVGLVVTLPYVTVRKKTLHEPDAPFAHQTPAG
jgi:bile acid:Na+ symporter, BASS family